MLCKKCLDISREKASEIKKGRLNPNWVEVKKPRIYIKIDEATKLENRKKVSERMRANNPSKNKESIEKGKITRLNNKTVRIVRNKRIYIKSLYKRGPEHHLWKGNRNRNQTVRTRLYKPWVFPILEKNNFSCERCGKSKCRLEVHHNAVPFRDIVKIITDNSFSGRQAKELSQEEFELYSDLIVDYHIYNDIPGLCLCKDCHKELDSYRK